MLLGGLAHGDALEGVGQTVVRHGVEHLDRAVLVTLAGLRQQVRGVGHGLLAAGDDHVEFAGANELVGERDRVQAREADLVDRQRRDVHGDAGLHGGLAGRDLPGAGLEDLPHDHVLDLVAADPGAVEGGLDREAAEVGAGEGLERAEEPAHRGAGTRDDDGGRAVLSRGSRGFSGSRRHELRSPFPARTGRGVNEGLLECTERYAARHPAVGVIARTLRNHLRSAALNPC